MNTRNLKRYLYIAAALIAGVYSWWNNNRTAQQEEAPVPASTVAARGEDGEILDRISVSEIGKLRSRIGKETIVFGKVSGTSKSGSGHHFLNFPNGFKVVCLKDHVGGFGKGGPAGMFEGKLIEVQGVIANHNGKPQIAVESPEQVRVIDLGKGGATTAAGGEFKLIETGRDTWVSPAGLRYKGRDAQGKTRKAHVLRHAEDQPSRNGSHGVFDADGDAVFALVDAAWRKIQEKRIRPQVEAGSETYLVPMGRRIGYLGGKTGARKRKPALKSVFIVVRKGTRDVVTAYPR